MRILNPYERKLQQRVGYLILVGCMIIYGLLCGLGGYVYGKTAKRTTVETTP